MSTNYTIPDTTYGTIDLEDKYITDAWMIEQFVGNTLYSWGNGSYGRSGTGYVGTHYSSPIQLGSLNNWKQLSMGSLNASAIKTDNTLWTWGYNETGALGNGTNSTTVFGSTPAQVGSLTNWKQVSSNGGNFVASIKTDNTLWTWGSNYYGTLGNGTTTNYSSPIQIGSLTNWKQVSAGSNHITAIKLDGTLWAWGSNTYGQLGNNASSSTTYYSSPIQVGSLTNWKMVSSNHWYTVAVKTDGTLWGWGWNTNYNLGIGSSTHYSSPVQIGSLTDWKQVEIGSNQEVAAIKTDGTLWMWGLNGQGHLGTGNTISYSSPIQIGSLTNWKQVTCGYATAAIKTDGTLWAWGPNPWGNLGNGTIVNYSSPIQIGLSTNWKQVSSYSTTVAITFSDV